MIWMKRLWILAYYYYLSDTLVVLSVSNYSIPIFRFLATMLFVLPKLSSKRAPFAQVAPPLNSIGGDLAFRSVSALMHCLPTFPSSMDPSMRNMSPRNARNANSDARQHRVMTRRRNSPRMSIRLARRRNLMGMNYQQCRSIFR